MRRSAARVVAVSAAPVGFVGSQPTTWRGGNSFIKTYLESRCTALFAGLLATLALVGLAFLNALGGNWPHNESNVGPSRVFGLELLLSTFLVSRFLPPEVLGGVRLSLVWVVVTVDGGDSRLQMWQSNPRKQLTFDVACRPYSWCFRCLSRFCLAKISVLPSLDYYLPLCWALRQS